MKSLVLLAAFAGRGGAQLVAPLGTSKVVAMLSGDWRMGTADVTFGADGITFDTASPVLVGRIRSSPESQWRRFLVVAVQGRDIRADFTDAKGKTTSYRLRTATDILLRFEDDTVGARQCIA
ncbi:MAG: hypothetical protein KGN84_19595 [Acidobacteriota bacterium]|nr:hypothetical protein [Acidobacteriota bacterium]